MQEWEALMVRSDPKKGEQTAMPPSVQPSKTLQRDDLVPEGSLYSPMASPRYAPLGTPQLPLAYSGHRAAWNSISPLFSFPPGPFDPPDPYLLGSSRSPRPYPVASSSPDSGL